MNDRKRSHDEALGDNTQMPTETTVLTELDTDDGESSSSSSEEEGATSLFSRANNCIYGIQGERQDFEKALKLYQKAADQGDIDSFRELARICCEGKYGVPKDLDKGLQLYQKAADQGDTWSIRDLAKVYCDGKYGVTKDLDKGLQLYQKGAELDDGYSMCGLGRCYRDGKGTDCDVELARTWFRKSFENGCDASLFAWALTKVEDALTPSQKETVDEISWNDIARYVVYEWLKWNTDNAGYSQISTLRISLFDRLDDTTAKLLVGQLLATTLDPTNLRTAHTLIKGIDTDTNDLHVPSQWLKLLVDDQHDEDELWSKVNLPNDYAFTLNYGIFPFALIGFGQFGKVYLSWLGHVYDRCVVIKFIPFDLATKNKIAARNVVREQLTCRVLQAKQIKNTVKYLGYTDDVESKQRGLIFGLCADISDVKERADKIRDKKIWEDLENTIQLEQLPDWTDKVKSSLRSSVVFCKKNKWSVAQVITMLRQAAEALLEVHKLGYIHRDIADRNILCDGEGNIQLADFGLAKYVGSNHDDASLIGDYGKQEFTPGHQYTLAWWAPECFGSEEDGEHGIFSWNSDVYAFGIMMWQCFAHDDPYSHVKAEVGKEDEVADRIKALIWEGKRPSIIKKPKRGGKLDKDTPDDLITLIDLCWKADPDERPTLVKLIDDLEEIESMVTKNGKSSRGGRMTLKKEPHKSWFDVAAMYKYRKPPPKEKSPVTSPEDQAPRGDFEYFFDLAQNALEIHLKKAVENRVPAEIRDALKQLPYDVFLVHAGEKKMDTVATMKHFLENSNLRCFLDRFGLESGEYPRETMRFALETCRYAVVVLSKEFFEKRHPSSELKYAFKRREWIKENYGWKSLHVVLYGMTVDQFKAKSPTCNMREYFPADLCGKVVLTHWLNSGEKTWIDHCSELKKTLINKDDEDDAVEKWKKFLKEYAAGNLEGFPPSADLYLSSNSSG